MSRDRLSALEVVYFTLEHSGAPIQVTSVGLFEAGPLLDEQGVFRLAEVRAHIESRLHLLPHVRQRIAPVPFGLARPEWVDDTTFDIADHVTAVSLWAPHDEQALRELVAELHMRPLDPLMAMWHLCFVTGLEGDRVALVQRTSHALADGVSGVDLATVLLDLERDTATAEAPPWVPEAPTPPGRAFTEALRDQAAVSLRLAGAALGAVRHPQAIARQGRLLRRVAAGMGHDGVLAPSTSLNRPVGARRRLLWVRRHLDEVRAAGAAAGATVNDVVLTAVAGGVRELLLARGEGLPADLTLKVLVPVSLRQQGERGALGNRVGGMFLPLPVGIGDPHERLAAVAAVERELKERHEAEASDLLLAAADLLPPPALEPLAGLLDRQPFVNLIVTNVPGPSVPLYTMGAELLEAFPMVPLAGNLTLGVAVLSYRNALTLGVTADTRTCPDAEVFVAGMEHAFAELGAQGTPSTAVTSGRAS
jgi:WS/DGAT/MGAT family acyltransferase